MASALLQKRKILNSFFASWPTERRLKTWRRGRALTSWRWRALSIPQCASALHAAHCMVARKEEKKVRVDTAHYYSWEDFGLRVAKLLELLSLNHKLKVRRKPFFFSFFFLFFLFAFFFLFFRLLQKSQAIESETFNSEEFISSLTEICKE